MNAKEYTPLMVAALGGKTDLVLLFCIAGADINTTDQVES